MIVVPSLQEIRAFYEEFGHELTVEWASKIRAYIEHLNHEELRQQLHSSALSPIIHDARELKLFALQESAKVFAALQYFPWNKKEGPTETEPATKWSDNLLLQLSKEIYDWLKE